MCDGKLALTLHVYVCKQLKLNCVYVYMYLLL